jgi:hypothetical protein
LAAESKSRLTTTLQLWLAPRARLNRLEGN